MPVVRSVLIRMFTNCRDRRPRLSAIHNFGRDIVFSADLCYKDKMDELKKRKTPRYQSFDYNRVGVYFITICTQNRRCILSRTVGTGVLDCPQPELTRYGEPAASSYSRLSSRIVVAYRLRKSRLCRLVAWCSSLR